MNFVKSFLTLNLFLLISILLYGCPGPGVKYNKVDVSSQESFKRGIDDLYKPQPHLLNSKEVELFSMELDYFWNAAEDNPEAYIQRLSKELQVPGHPPFFYYDAGRLLVQLSDARESKEILSKSLVNANIEDVTGDEYLSAVHRLAVQGLDVTEAALNILENPGFTAEFPQYELTLGQGYAFLFMLFPMEETLYLDKIIAAFSETRDPVAQESIALVLWHTFSDKGWEALKQIHSNLEISEDIRKSVRDLLSPGKTLDELENDIRFEKILNKFKNYTFEELKEKKRQALKKVGNDALTEFNELTLVQLYKRYK